jgi:Cell wall-active antibiotics response 4TMS YvqF
MRLFRTLFLIELGAWIGALSAAAFVKRAIPSRGDEDSDEVALVAIFEGIKLKSRSQAFRGGSMFAWVGGIDVDLREAQLAPDATLTLHTLFGGIAVRVPPGVRVESGLTALAGGVDARGLDETPGAPTLRLEGMAVFGGIAVGAKVEEIEADAADIADDLEAAADES